MAPSTGDKRPYHALHHGPASAWIVLGLSLLLTVLAWYIADDAVRTRASERFEFQAQDVTLAISKRMEEYAMALRSGVGLMGLRDSTTREDWRRFTATLGLQTHFPGIQGLGYAVMLSPEEVDEHVAQVRREGFEDYTIRPSGEREEYSAIVYLEPFDWRNRRAFGYDMFSEPTRHEAMARARDSGKPAVSGRVTLVQETDENHQYGLLMYYPVYGDGPVSSVDQRRAALRGFVYSPFRMGDLMRGILGADQGDLDFEIYDGAAARADTILYNNTGSQELRYLAEDDAPDFAGLYQIELSGHDWTLYLYSQENYLSGAEKSQPTLVAIGGLLVDLLLFIIISNLARQQQRAEELARKMTEELSASEERYRRLFRDSGAVMLLCDPESGQIVDANEAAVAFYAYELATLCTMRLADLCPLPEAEFDAIEAEAAIRGPEGPRLPQRLATGEIRQVELRRSDIELDGRTMALSVIFNVTARHRAEELLQASERRYQAVFELTPVPMLLFESETLAIIEVNDSAIVHYGHSRLEFLAMSLHDLQADKTAPPPEGVLSSQTAEKSRTEAIHRKRDGAEVFVEIHTCPFIYAGRDVRIAVISDVTARTHANRIMVAAREAAELASRAKSDFVANMSHELRTPMSALIGLGQLLEDMELPPRAQDYVSLIRSSSQTMLALLNDILDHSKIEANRIELEERPFHLEEVIMRSLALFSARAESKGLALAAEIDDDVPQELCGDALRLGQVLNNLLGNAVKFTERGQIRLHVELSDADQDSTAVLRVTVHDTGIGIAAGDLESLFEPFHQADATMTRRFGGTGLGLSISRALVELMGGSLGVRSDLGIGSDFFFTARFTRGAPTLRPSDLIRPTKGEERAPWHARGAPLRGTRVLLAEDNATNQVVASALLERIGISPVIAQNGEEALHRLQQGMFDLVLMDLQMPVMGGLEATRRIRAMGGQNGHIPVIALTASALAEDHTASQMVGMDAHLTKPIDANNLVDTLLDTLARARHDDAQAGSENAPPPDESRASRANCP